MIVILAAAFGAVLGYLQARLRGGNGFDRAQYAAVYGILLALLGLFATVALQRLG